MIGGTKSKGPGTTASSADGNRRGWPWVGGSSENEIDRLLTRPGCSLMDSSAGRASYAWLSDGWTFASRPSMLTCTSMTVRGRRTTDLSPVLGDLCNVAGSKVAKESGERTRAGWDSRVRDALP